MQAHLNISNKYILSNLDQYFNNSLEKYLLLVYSADTLTLLKNVLAYFLIACYNKIVLVKMTSVFHSILFEVFIVNLMYKCYPTKN